MESEKEIFSNNVEERNEASGLDISSSRSVVSHTKELDLRTKDSADDHDFFEALDNFESDAEDEEEEKFYDLSPAEFSAELVTAETNRVLDEEIISAGLQNLISRRRL